MDTINRTEVIELLGCSEAKVDRAIKSRRFEKRPFPEPVTAPGKVKRWRRSEILALKHDGVVPLFSESGQSAQVHAESGMVAFTGIFDPACMVEPVAKLIEQRLENAARHGSLDVSLTAFVERELPSAAAAVASGDRSAAHRPSSTELADPARQLALGLQRMAGIDCTPTSNFGGRFDQIARDAWRAVEEIKAEQNEERYMREHEA